MDQRSRGWCFTWNNYTEDDLTRVDQMECEYLVCGKEIAPTTGTPHLQGYVYWANARTGKSVKKKLATCVHLEAAKGTPQQNAEYCKKGGDFIEKGECPAPGKRTDLDVIAQSILSGEQTLDAITYVNPMAFHQYGRTLERVQDLYFRALPPRSTMTRGIWLYGPTECGKSHFVFNYDDISVIYNYPYERNGWWDNYSQHRVVAMQEFRGQLKFGELLSLVDKWPHVVPRRGRSPMEFTSQVIIFTSDQPPEEVFKNVEADRMQQLHRRLTTVKVTDRSGKGVKESYNRTTGEWEYEQIFLDSLK